MHQKTPASEQISFIVNLVR